MKMCKLLIIESECNAGMPLTWDSETISRESLETSLLSVVRDEAVRFRVV